MVEGSKGEREKTRKKNTQGYPPQKHAKKNNNNSIPNSLNEDHAKAQKQITIPAENRKNPLKQNKTPPEKQNQKSAGCQNQTKNQKKGKNE